MNKIIINNFYKIINSVYLPTENNIVFKTKMTTDNDYITNITYNNPELDDNINVIYQANEIGIDHMLSSPLDILKKINVSDINGIQGIPINVTPKILDDFNNKINSFYNNGDINNNTPLPPLTPLNDSLLSEHNLLPDTPELKEFPDLLPKNSLYESYNNSKENNLNYNCELQNYLGKTEDQKRLNKHFEDQNKCLNLLIENKTISSIELEKIVDITRFICRKSYFKLFSEIRSNYKKKLNSIVDIVHKSDVQKKKNLLNRKKGKKKIFEQYLNSDKTKINMLFSSLKQDLSDIIDKNKLELEEEINMFKNWSSLQ